MVHPDGKTYGYLLQLPTSWIAAIERLWGNDHKGRLRVRTALKRGIEAEARARGVSLPELTDTSQPAPTEAPEKRPWGVRA